MATQATQAGAVVFSSLVQTALIEQPVWGMFSQETDVAVSKVNGQYPSTIKMIRLGQATVTDLTSSYPVLGAGAGDTLSRTEISMSIKKAGISGANSIRIQNFEQKLHGMTIQSGLIQTVKEWNTGSHARRQKMKQYISIIFTIAPAICIGILCPL